MVLHASESSALLGSHVGELSDIGALMHIFKGTVGTGILGLPWAIEHAGIIVGPVAMLLIGLVNLHCMHLLVNSATHLAKTLDTPALDYGDVAMNAFRYSPYKFLRTHASKARIFVNICLEMTQLGLCCTYTVFVGQNLRQFIAVYWYNAPDDRAFMAILCLPFVLVCLIRNLSVLAWFSSAANIAAIISICMILRNVLPGLPSITERPYVANLSEFAIFIGAAIGAFEGIPVILPVRNAMKTPENFSTMLNIGIGLIICLYILIAFVGYLKFGAAICGSITLNLPLNNAFSDSARILYCFAMFFTFPLQFYVAMEIVEGAIESKFDIKEIWCSIITRVCFVVGICSFAIAIPYIGDLNSLIGATSSTMLVVLFPPLLNILANKAHKMNLEEENETEEMVTEAGETSREEEVKGGLSKWVTAKNIIIITFATVAFVSGLTQTIISIVYAMEHHSSENKCQGGVGKIRSNHSLANTHMDFTTVSPEIMHTSIFL